MISLELAVDTSDIHSLAMKIAIAMNLSFSARESSYWGEYLTCRLPEGGTLEVLNNANPMYEEGDPDEERYFNLEHKDCGSLIRGSLTEEQETALLACLSGSSLRYAVYLRE